MKIQRGDIVLADLTNAAYCEQGKMRPVIVIQNDVGNMYSPTTIIVPLTSHIKKVDQPTHTIITKEDATGLKSDSMVMCEQVRTIDKRRITVKVGKVTSENAMKAIFNAYFANVGEC